jgi:Fe-S cluster assembly protein SufB
LQGEGARGQILSIAVAGKGQQQDTGGKIIHCAPHTTSNIISKSISKQGGRSSYRGLLKVIKGAHNVKAKVQCDALLFDEHSRSDTYPTVLVKEPLAEVGHEASVSKVSEEQLFYAQSRGLSQQAARAMVVNGFIDVFVQQLPMEYAVEINRLIAMEMEGSIG